jgi:tetratricopeptide (TPR) repeat protein
MSPLGQLAVEEPGGVTGSKDPRAPGKRWRVRFSPLFFCVPLIVLLSFQFNMSSPPSSWAEDSQSTETLTRPSTDLSTDRYADSRQRFAELSQAGRWTEVATLAQELLPHSPAEPMIHYWLGQARLNLHDTVGAIKALRAAERLGLDTLDLRMALGTAYFNLNQFLLFEQQTERAIRTNPTSREPYYALGRYYESIRSDAARALKYFEKANTLNPEDARSWAHQGYCLEMLRRGQEARRAYETAIALEKDEKLSLPYQGLARLSLQAEPERALSFAKKAVEFEPDSDASHFLLAKVYQRLGKPSDAVTELETAIRLNPTDLAPRLVLSQIYTRIGKKQAAEAERRMIEEIGQIYGVR